MTVIAMRQFGGETPKLPASVLPDHGAQLAMNCNLAHTDLRPLNSPLVRTQLSRTGTVRTLYTEDGQNFYSWSDNGFAVRSPQKTDDYGRFYYTIEDGFNPGLYVYTKKAFAPGLGGTIGQYPSVNPAGGSPPQLLFVGVPKPPTAPSVSAVSSNKFPGVDSYSLAVNFFYEKDGARYQESPVDIPAAGVANGAAPFYFSTFDPLRQYSIQIPALISDPAVQPTVYIFINQIAYGSPLTALLIGTRCQVIDSQTITVVGGGPHNGQTYTGVTGYSDVSGVVHTLADAISAASSVSVTPADATPVVEITFTDTTTVNGTSKNSVIFHGFSSNSVQANNGSSAATGTTPTINMSKQDSSSLYYTINIDYPVYETRAYVYTVVNAWGEESVPSEPTIVSLTYDQTVNVSISYANNVYYKEQMKGRIYRSAQNNAGTTDYQLVNADDAFNVYSPNGAVNTFVYNDAIPTARLQESIPSTTWDCPPKVLHNITAMPNGVLAAFVGNQLYFSDPYHPFAWPVDYIQTFPWDIVGLKVSGSALVVTTKAYPYVVNGSHPDSMSALQLPLLQAGVSPYSMVDMGSQVAYLSKDGIVVVQGTTGTMSYSQQLFAREDWRGRYDSPPTTYLDTYRLGVYDGALIGVSAFGPGFIIRIDEDAGVYSQYSQQFDGAFLLPQTDSFYVTSGNVVSSFNEGVSPLTFIWQSKDHVVTRPTNFGVCQVVASPGPTNGSTLKVEVLTDGVVTSTTNLNITSASLNSIFRLPSGFLGRRHSVRLTGNCTVKEIYLANLPSELQGV